MIPARLEALKRAVEICGGMTPFAKRIGATRAQVWNWLNRDKNVPARYVLPIERATRRWVGCYELRPDVYPPEEYTPKILPHIRLRVRPESRA